MGALDEFFGYTFILLVLILWQQQIHSYEIRCPEQSEWSFKAIAKCDNILQYFCLLDDNVKIYTEFCKRNPDITRDITWKKGHKCVFRGNLDGEVCSTDRYQPFKFQTDGNSDCAYEKSNCQEEGMIIYKNGSTTLDTQCRCDHTKGFAFVSKTKQSCYCIPSQEDCSCYKKECKKNTKLSSDYNCIFFGSHEGTSACASFDPRNILRRFQLERMCLLLILTCIAYLTFCSSNYEYLCPTALNWQIRSTALCTSTDKYSCLHDENTDTLREICRESPSMLAAGNRYVIRGNLDGEYCNENRYQPFIFKTNKDNECAIQKSNCDEAGQIIYSNGSTTEDKSCRCDYSKSYAPIKKPSNPCYCVPSKEDCSCYLKLCPEKTHLSSEYICVSDYTLMTLDECGQILLTRSEDSNIIRQIDRFDDTETFTTERDNELLMMAQITVLSGLLLIVLLAVCTGLLFAVFLCIISVIISSSNFGLKGPARAEKGKKGTKNMKR